MNQTRHRPPFVLPSAAPVVFGRSWLWAPLVATSTLLAALLFAPLPAPF